MPGSHHPGDLRLWRGHLKMSGWMHWRIPSTAGSGRSLINGHFTSGLEQGIASNQTKNSHPGARAGAGASARTSRNPARQYGAALLCRMPLRGSPSQGLQQLPARLSQGPEFPDVNFPSWQPANIGRKARILALRTRNASHI